MRRTEMRRHKAHLRDGSGSLRHACSNRKKHTHTLETEKPGGRRGGEEIKEESGRKRREGGG